MRWGGAADRAYETYFARAIIDGRSTMHLSWRLLIRASWVIDPVGRATAGAGLWHWVLPAFIALDVVVWFVLRRRPGLGLGWRLALDSVDIAFWSLSPLPRSGYYDGAVLIGVPLAVESGFRLSHRALIVPVVALMVTATVRVVAGRAALPLTFGWLVLGMGVGMGLYLYCRRLHDEAEAERARVGEAERRRAFVAGENSVAMGASSVVDAIEGIVPVLGRPQSGSALSHLAAGWKASLGERTRGEATYLKVALLEWERAHNDHPDLATHVKLHPDALVGTTLLTTSQVSALGASLDSLDLRGSEPMALAGSAAESGLPGRALRVRVGSHVVQVPADPEARQQPVDPAPVAFLFIAGQCVATGSGGGGLVPPWVVAILIALCVGTWWWSHRTLLAHGPAARPAILLAAVTLALVITAVHSQAMTARLNPDGIALYAVVGVMLLAYVGGFYWYGLPTRMVVLLAGGAGATATVALLLSPGPLGLRSFVTALIGSVAPFPTTRRVSISLGHARERHIGEARDEDQAATLAAFRRGQDVVVSLVRQARDDACRQLSLLGSSLDPALAKVVARRLEEVDRRLTRLDEPLASSSSMTTS